MKLLSYDRAKLNLEPKELHTKQDPCNTWHCAPVYACIKNWSKWGFVILKVQDSLTVWQDYKPSEYCSWPGPQASLDYPRLEQESPAPSWWKFFGIRCSYQHPIQTNIKYDTQTNKPDRSGRVVGTKIIWENYQEWNFKAEM